MAKAAVTLVTLLNPKREAERRFSWLRLILSSDQNASSSLETVRSHRRQRATTTTQSCPLKSFPPASGLRRPWMVKGMVIPPSRFSPSPETTWG